MPVENLVVFAAASLTEPFEEFRHLFEARHPGVEVRLNLAAASALRILIEMGTPCDVFASADRENIQTLQEKDIVLESGPFAHNKLCVIVPKANRAGINSLEDLTRPGIRIATEPETYPMGRYMRQILDHLEESGEYGEDFKGKMMQNIGDQEINVKHIVAKVIREEFDAGFVYVSDATPTVRNDVTMIPIPDRFNVMAHYAIAVIQHTKVPSLAREFAALVSSREGQEILASCGFLRLSAVNRE